MAAPLYFLPRMTRAVLCPQGKLSRAILRERGLAEVFADVISPDKDCLLNEPSSLGPGGQSGLYLAYQTPSGELPAVTGFHADRQDWHAVGDGSGLWIGILKDSPSTPEDMRRKRQFDGYAIELADGQRWNVPVIRRDDGSSELPRDLLLDAAGNVTDPIKAPYLRYWEASGEVADWFFGAGMTADAVPLGKAVRLAIDALSLNYRIDRPEQNVLRLIDSTNWQLVLAYSVDVPKVQRLESLKKSDSAPSIATSNTTPGSQNGSAVTGPAAETCISPRAA